MVVRAEWVLAGGSVALHLPHVIDRRGEVGGVGGVGYFGFGKIAVSEFTYEFGNLRFA